MPQRWSRISQSHRPSNGWRNLNFICERWHQRTVKWVDALIHQTSRSWSSWGRQSVDQFVWVSGLPFGPLTRFYLALLSSSDIYFILLWKAPSLTRKRVCSVQCNHSLVRLLTPNNHTLPSHLRLCSLFVASYDSQGLRWRYFNPPPHGVNKPKRLKHVLSATRKLKATFCWDRKRVLIVQIMRQAITLT
jgi:hypothetical protein